MAWSETEISPIEVEKKEKTIAIFCAGQAGDCLTISSVLMYRHELWGDCKIVWYIAEGNEDLLKYQDIELRTFPRGFGYPEMVIEENNKLRKIGKEPVWEDWAPLVSEDNEMNWFLKSNYPSLNDIDCGYFPAPHQMTPSQRHGLTYPEVSKKVFGIPNDYPWHPVLSWSGEEKLMADIFMTKIGRGKIVYVETFAGSGQSRLNEEMIVDAMNLCREHWDGCSFIFGSHKYLKGNEQFPEHFFEQENVYSSAEFTVRQSALITSACDLMISVSSGLTVAASAWGVSQPATLQFCGSKICSTEALAHTNFQLVTADDKRFEDSKIEFYTRLVGLLNRYK